MQRIFVLFILFSITSSFLYSQLPANEWVLDDDFDKMKYAQVDFNEEYIQVEKMVRQALAENEGVAFASKRVYEEIILQHIDSNNVAQIDESYEWLENEYLDFRSKYIDNIHTIINETQSVGEIYLRYEDSGNLLTGRASALITTHDNESYVVIFKNLCKVNEKWYITNDVKLKPFNQ